ncbi:hypothetical protein GJR96_14070 [Haloferax sp. MBLA0076]|uniref:Uncharacterized protein n=1 Tax=Haloferax litoreum TaxID=2666140 RepID=A0A6A8GJD1_9EURY|nr:MULTISPECIES: hypothetical protein [Haloferax]KAB1194505.1 hypothetical protein Hfx1148_14005 [Haloferax sp. CBA1148]MRX23076.1 hypothetical protein [Haloferax litoreum]
MVSRGDMDAPAKEASAFQLGLDDLKRRGSALLVVGSVPTELYSRASKQMLGAPTEPRRRLVVLNESASLDARLDPAVRRSTEWTRVIRYSTLERSAASTAYTPDPVQQRYERRVSGGVGRLGSEIATDIQEFDSFANMLSPAELRVAFDCLPALLSKYDRETVFRFLHVTATHVRSRKGMLHVWSPGGRDDELNRMLTPLFDAVVELDVHGTDAMQRWHLLDIDVSSGWFPLDS